MALVGRSVMNFFVLVLDCHDGTDVCNEIKIYHKNVSMTVQHQYEKFSDYDNALDSSRYIHDVVVCFKIIVF